MRAFGYVRPASLGEAIALLAERGPDARPLAGGTDLIIRLRDGSIRPEVVVDIKAIPELDAGIRQDGDRLVIGARAVMTDIAADARVRRHFPALAEAALVVGSAQIRNRATLAGNLCNASPAADTAPALLVYGATVVAAGSAGERRLPVDELWVRSGVTTLAGDELVTAVELPIPASTTDRSTSGGRAAAGTTSPRSRSRARSGPTASPASVTGASARGRCSRVDESGVLADPAASDESKADVLERLLGGATPSPTSMRASPEYRLAMLRVLGRRAVEASLRRLAEGASG